jgi:AraC family transcriptional regulator of adaptative response/methylated-DNA-[protein]-cysteine methyltransferase
MRKRTAKELTAKALIAELHSRFQEVELHVGDAGFEAWVAKVVRAVETPDSTLDIPLDPRGTAFQQRVWQALREIPVGTVANYQEIARKVGMSKTAQDVAEACAANTLAIVIPCHRVIRSDGSLAGYRWGLKRKRALLQKEQEASPEPGSLFHAAALAAH